MVHDVMFMSQGRSIPWVRVPGHDHAAIGYALDAGASIVIPQVDTVEQARHVISSAKFGSKQNGTRSAPPFRLIPGLTDMPYDPSRDLHSCLNDQAAIMIQIESLEGIKNLDAILTEVPDIDIVFIGRLDARVSMNLAAQFGQGDEPEWTRAVEDFHATLKKHKMPYCGMYLGPADENMTKAGKEMEMMVCAADVLALAGMADTLTGARKVMTAGR